jgi:hypothetical protein
MTFTKVLAFVAPKAFHLALSSSQTTSWNRTFSSRYLVKLEPTPAPHNSILGPCQEDVRGVHAAWMWSLLALEIL